jgi:hypothetical protein
VRHRFLSSSSATWPTRVRHQLQQVVKPSGDLLAGPLRSAGSGQLAAIAIHTSNWLRSDPEELDPGVKGARRAPARRRSRSYDELGRSRWEDRRD